MPHLVEAALVASRESVPNAFRAWKVSSLWNSLPQDVAIALMVHDFKEGGVRLVDRAGKGYFQLPPCLVMHQPLPFLIGGRQRRRSRDRWAGPTGTHLAKLLPKVTIS